MRDQNHIKNQDTDNGWYRHIRIYDGNFTLIMAIKFNHLGAEVSLLLLVTFGYGLIGF